jgi:hypothetical protein
MHLAHAGAFGMCTRCDMVCVRFGGKAGAPAATGWHQAEVAHVRLLPGWHRKCVRM